MAGFLCRYGRLDAEGPVSFWWSLLTEMTGPSYAPPWLSRSNYRLASFSRTFLRDCLEWTPLRLGLAASTYSANLDASLSSLESFYSSSPLTLSSHPGLSSSIYPNLDLTLLFDTWENLDTFVSIDLASSFIPDLASKSTSPMAAVGRPLVLSASFHSCAIFSFHSLSYLISTTLSLISAIACLTSISSIYFS